KHPPAARFNAGQKMIYWIVVIGGAAAATGGFFLLYLFYFDDIPGMQVGPMVFRGVGVFFFAPRLAALVIRAGGVDGAFEAMGSGKVDVNWAKQHHSVWFEKESVNAPADGAPDGHMAPAE